VSLTELPDTIRIAFDGFLPPETDRHDPLFIGVLGGTLSFAEPTFATMPFVVEYDEPARLDPKRSGLIWELPPVVVGWAIRWRALLVSLAFHSLPVVVIALLPLLLVEPPPPIPVQLVFEQPPPPPPPPPPVPKPPPPPKMEVGPLASVDMGTVKPPDLGRTPDPVPMPSAGPQQETPTETQTATAEQAPPMPQPRPAQPKEQKSAFNLPKPSGANVPHREKTPREAPRSARYPGPAATRDEYLAYITAVIRQHLVALPPSAISGRRVELVLSIRLSDSGAIASVSLLHSSGNPEADMQIVQAISSIHKFPPIPQWFQGNAAAMEYILPAADVFGRD
jgi:TonB family protein